MRLPASASPRRPPAPRRARGRGSRPACPGPPARRGAASRASTRAARPARASTGLRFARSFAGTDGYRGRFRPSLTRHDRGQRHVVDVAAAGDLLLAARAAVGDASGPSARSRPAARARTRRGSRPGSCPRPPTRCRRRSGRTAPRRASRRRSRPPSPARPTPRSLTRWIAAVGADRHALAQLLLRLGRPEREHDDLAALRLDDAHRLLDAALLVRRDREAEVPRLDRLLVVGQHHLPAGDRHPLDADEDPHERTRAFSGSKTGVESFVATVDRILLADVLDQQLLADVRVLGRQVRSSGCACRSTGPRPRSSRTSGGRARRRAARPSSRAPARGRACSASCRSSTCGRRPSACRAPRPAPARGARRAPPCRRSPASFTFPTPCRPRRRRSRRRARTRTRGSTSRAGRSCRRRRCRRARRRAARPASHTRSHSRAPCSIGT